MLERLQQHAQDHHSAITALSTEQGDAIVRAAQLLVEALVQEHRLFCAGLGGCNANAQSFVHKLIHHFEHERPALPAIALSGDSSVGAEGQTQELFARPFQALARSGDVLVVMKPYYFLSKYETGTTHGSPHSYDTHVPLLAMGPGIKAGVHKELVTPQAGVQILSRALGIKPPASADAELPKKVFGD